MYLTLTVQSVVCNRGKSHDAEVIVRYDDNSARQVVVMKGCSSHDDAALIADKKAREIMQKATEVALTMAANFPAAKE